MASEVLYSNQDGVARIKLNRPEKLNALNAELQSAFWESIQKAESDDSVRVIVLSGEGRCFSAGGDLNWVINDAPKDPEARIMARGADPWVQARAHSLNTWDNLWRVPKPIVAQVHGYCLAGACEMAFFSDITIASEDALFGEPESKNGWVAASVWLLGPKVAREILLLGDMFSAKDALRIGLINRVVPRSELDAATDTVVQQLLAIPPSSLALVKRMGERFYKAIGFPAVAQSAGEMALYVRAIQEYQGNDVEFNRLVKEQGLSAALAARDRADSPRPSLKPGALDPSP